MYIWHLAMRCWLLMMVTKVQELHDSFLLSSKWFIQAVKSLEEEEMYLKKELNKTQQPITYLDTSQHRQEAEERDVQGRCFTSTSNRKRFRDESNLSGNSSFLYSQHLPMIKEGLYQHERRMRGDDVIMSSMQGLASKDQHNLPNAREKGKGVLLLGRF